MTEDSNILFDDTIFVEVDIDLNSILSADIWSKFPGVDQFKKDVLDILENEYGFEVIEDVYDGIKQKGYISNREDSVSIYFDTYFDLSKSGPALKRSGVSTIAPQEGTIFCFVHIRFSDHDLADEGDVEHRKFINRNAQKYVSNRPEVTHVMKEEQVEVDPLHLNRYYDRALASLKVDLDSRILAWNRKADFYKR